MYTTTEIGRRGEKLAANYLKKHGYKILETNRYQSHKEIDLIAENQEYMVFVEVKTRSVKADLYSAYGTPAAAVTKQKQMRLLQAAGAYLATHGTEKQPRMDVVEIYLDFKTGKLLTVHHIENAFGRT